MDLGDLKLQLQNHFRDGLCIIVGSGLSCAEGLPSMFRLAEDLGSALPGLLDQDGTEYWNLVANDVKNEGLEAALLARPPTSIVERHIVSVCAESIEKAEQKVINEVFASVRRLPLTMLFGKVIIPNSGFAGDYYQLRSLDRDSR